MIHYDWKLDWANISVGEYIELQELVVDNEEGLEQEDLIMQEIQLLYGKDPYRMGIPEFKKCIDSLQFISTPMPNMKVKDTYTLNGCTYYLHKKLEDFKVAQWIDYGEIMKNGKGVENYPQFIALFMTPSSEGSYGDGYDVDAVVKDIAKYMSIADACSIAAFFLKSSKLFIALSLLSSHRTAMKAMKDRKKKKLLRRKTMQMIRLVLAGE